MKHRLITLSATLLCATALAQPVTPVSSAAGRTQPSPEEMGKMMEATMNASMNAMVPAMTKASEAILEVTLQKGEDPATARRIARFKRNLYEALLKEGFSKPQAFAILQTTNVPTAAPAMK